MRKIQTSQTFDRLIQNSQNVKNQKRQSGIFGIADVFISEEPYPLSQQPELSKSNKPESKAKKPEHAYLIQPDKK